MAFLRSVYCGIYQQTNLSLVNYIFISGTPKTTICVSSFQPLWVKRDCHFVPKVSVLSTSSSRIKTISKSMRAYLERAVRHENFIKEKDAEFEVGKRHLANMMGMDANDLTQQDIDKAIEYLLPSGLYQKKARPQMTPPKDLYPKEKAAEFDSSGRPFSCFFYTRKSKLYTILHSTVEKFKELDEFEDKMLRRGIKEPPKEYRLNLGGSGWLDAEVIETMLLESITEQEYNFFIETLNRLSVHPYAFRCKEHIFQFRKLFPEISSMDNIPSLIEADDGSSFITMSGKRKTAIADVIVRRNGTGKLKINGDDISYFSSLQDREQILFPLNFTGMLNLVDVEAKVEGGGHAAQAGAIRLGLSKALRSFVTPEDVEKMRLVGLLTRDIRRKERKKPGQKGARAKYKWLKR